MAKCVIINKNEKIMRVSDEKALEIIESGKGYYTTKEKWKKLNRKSKKNKNKNKSEKE